MTADEKRLQRAQVLIDLEDAEGELGALRTKAHRTAEALKDISNKIRNNAELDPSPNDFSPDYELKNRIGPQAQGEFITYTDALRLIEDLKVARQKVVNLQRQKNMTR